MTGADIQIRHLETAYDYRACEELQRITWGADFREVVPAAILKISQKVGGIAAGAFGPDTAMTGFVFGITGWKLGRACHWSHMLAVHPSHQDGGTGRRLKEFQRAELRANGVEIMYWTYDPLVARNAHLNLRRLGVSINEYVPNMYGAADDNSLDHIIGTDRFIVEWDLTGSRQCPHEEDADAILVNARVTDAGDVQLTDFIPRDAPSVRIAIPEDIHQLKSRNPTEAAEWRAITRRAFQYYLDRSYLVTNFYTDPSCRFSAYLMTKR